MPLPNVSFSSPQADRTTVSFYVRDQLPSSAATETTAAGNGGFLNFPAGTAEINVKENKTGIALATVSILVRPSFISIAYIHPESRKALTAVASEPP